MLNLDFSKAVLKVAQPRKRKEEAYSFPALTIHQTPEEKKECKFSLNNSALELLGIDVEAENLPYIGFLNGDDQPEQYRGRLFLFVSNEDNGAVKQIRKNGSFASKPHHEYLNEKISWINTADADQTFELVFIANASGVMVAEVHQLTAPEPDHEEVPQDADTQAQAVEEKLWFD